MKDTTDTRDRRYALLIDSDDLILVIGADGKRNYVNKAFADLWQTKAENLMGQTFTAGLPEDKAHRYMQQMASLTTEKPSVSLTIRSGIDGHREWVSWKATGIFDDSGTLLEVMVVGRNVNEAIETKQEKETLQNTLNAFKTAINSSMICTITDEKGIITYANRNFCEISQYSLREIHGRTHNIVNSGHHPRSFFTEMWQTICSGKMWTGEIKNRAKDGSYYWVNTVIIPIKNNRQKISGFLSLRIVINKQKEMEEERKIYQRSLEEMLFMVSHEIRRPIATSQGLLYLMRDDVPTTTEECQEMVGYLISTIEELNDYSYKLNEYLEKNIIREPIVV
ncbi:PAS domain S-box protein [Nemorincola caseinilytica]